MCANEQSVTLMEIRGRNFDGIILSIAKYGKYIGAGKAKCTMSKFCRLHMYNNRMGRRIVEPGTISTFSREYNLPISLNRLRDNLSVTKTKQLLLLLASNELLRKYPRSIVPHHRHRSNRPGQLRPTRLCGTGANYFAHT